MNLKEFLRDYVACKSVSSDPNCLSGMADARKHLIQFFSSLSIESREVEIGHGHHSIVFAKTKQSAHKPTILIYGHYDVQPADDIALWSSSPFSLQERNGRLYARGASDNKGAHSTILAAIYDILSSGTELPVNLKFIFEGEEEIGSGGMPILMDIMRQELRADFVLVADTWSFDENNIVITTALRGIVGCEIELVSGKSDLHSGYGGPVFNAVQELIELCASLHSNEGLVNIPGFYDDVNEPHNWERDQVAKLPLTDDKLKSELAIPNFKSLHTKFSAAESMRFLPTLEFNGITGGFQGDLIKTIIPCRASVKLSCRLVPSQNANSIKEAIRRTITKRCPQEMSIAVRFEQTSNPYFCDVRNTNNMPLRSAVALVDSEVAKTFGSPPTYLRDGGSIGSVTMFKEILKMDSLMVGLSTTADNIHAPDESISLAMLERGRKFFHSFFSKFTT